jgi:replicative DNA helicase
MARAEVKARSSVGGRWTMSDYIPPHSPDSEARVLGECIMSPEIIGQVADDCKADYFFSEKNRRVYEALVDMDARSITVDQVTLKDYLTNTQDTKVGIDCRTHIIQLADAALGAGVEQHITIIKRDFWQRIIIARIAEALDKAKEPTFFLDDTKQALVDLIDPLEDLLAAVCHE